MLKLIKIYFGIKNTSVLLLVYCKIYHPFPFHFFFHFAYHTWTKKKTIFKRMKSYDYFLYHFYIHFIFTRHIWITRPCFAYHLDKFHREENGIFFRFYYIFFIFFSNMNIIVISAENFSSFHFLYFLHVFSFCCIKKHTPMIMTVTHPYCVPMYVCMCSNPGNII